MEKHEQTILKNGEGGYIFISHSHYDIDKVRIIRNTLEEQGYEPLCFYLKCLNDKDEIEGLIKREIDIRDIFLYVESDNARQSKWVTKERKYISGLEDKTIYKISLDEDIDLKQTTLDILNMTRVFISYSHRDQALFNIIKDALTEKDLKVFDELSMLASGESFYDQIVNQIDFASKYGIYAIIVTQESIKSRAVVIELQEALKRSDYIVPIIVNDDGSALEDSLLYLLSITHPCAFIHSSPTEEDLKLVVSLIKNALKAKMIGL